MRFSTGENKKILFSERRRLIATINCASSADHHPKRLPLGVSFYSGCCIRFERADLEALVIAENNRANLLSTTLQDLIRGATEVLAVIHDDAT